MNESQCNFFLIDIFCFKNIILVRKRNLNEKVVKLAMEIEPFHSQVFSHED